MVRSYLPESELRREDVWLDAIESGIATTASIAEQTGYTRRRVQQRVKSARERRDRGERVNVLRVDFDRFDFPYMELVVVPPEHAEHEWEAIDGSAGSRESGTYHIGGQIRSLLGGHKAEDEAAEAGAVDKPTPKFRPRARVRRPKLLTPEEVAKIKAKGKKSPC